MGYDMGGPMMGWGGPGGYGMDWGYGGAGPDNARAGPDMAAYGGPSVPYGMSPGGDGGPSVQGAQMPMGGGPGDQGGPGGDGGPGQGLYQFGQGMFTDNPRSIPLAKEPYGILQKYNPPKDIQFLLISGKPPEGMG